MKKKDLFGKDRLSKFDKRFSSGYPTDKEIPAVIVLKRKAIRVYPDNQKIALYYSQALDKFVSVPFGPGNVSLGIQVNEARKTPYQDTLDSLKKAGYHEIAKEYERHKESGELSAEKALSRIARKRPLNKILSLPKHERDALLKHVNAHIENADMSPMRKLGLKHGIALRKAFTKPKETKPKETPAMPAKITESFKYKVSMIREARYGKADLALDVAGMTPGPIGSAASLASAGRSFSKGDYVGAGLDVVGALPGVGYLAKGAKIARGANQMRRVSKGKEAVEAARKTKIGSKERKEILTRAKERGKTRAKNKERLKKAGAFAAGVGAAATALGSAAKSATDTSGVMGNKQDYEFRQIQPKVGDPQGQSQKSWSSERIRLKQQGWIQESNNLAVIKHIVENNVKYHELTIGDRTVSLNNSVAKKVINLYESLNKQNKKKIEQMLNEDATSFRKVINFAIRQ